MATPLKSVGSSNLNGREASSARTVALCSLRAPPLRLRPRFDALSARRHRAIAMFVADYVACWVVAGVPVSLLRQWSPTHERSAAALAFVLAAGWSLHPWRARWHIRGAERPPGGPRRVPPGRCERGPLRHRLLATDDRVRPDRARVGRDGGRCLSHPRRRAHVPSAPPPDRARSGSTFGVDAHGRPLTSCANRRRRCVSRTTLRRRRRPSAQFRRGAPCASGRSQRRALLAAMPSAKDAATLRTRWLPARAGRRARRRHLP